MENHKIYRQYFAAVVANIPTIIFGISISWCSPYVPLLMSIETPLKEGPLSESDVSWISAGSSMGGLLSCFFFGFLLDTIGRKKSLIMLAVPQLLSWVCIHLAESGNMVMLGRVLGGISGAGAFIAAPVFVSEIADDNRRGVLGSFLSLGCNFGILLGFVLTTCFTYHQLPIVMEVLSIAYIIFALKLAESPTYNELKGRTKEALDSYEYYGRQQHIELAHEAVEEEIKIKSIPWKQIIFSLFLGFFSNSTGTFVIVGFVESIFDESGSQIPIEMVSIVIGIIQVFGAYVSTIVIEKYGRKSLLQFSAFTSSACLFATGAYYYLVSLGYDTLDYSYFPLVTISLLFFLTAIGLSSVPFVVMTEILPQTYRGPIYTVCMIEMWSIVILGYRFFLPMMGYYGRNGFMWFFAITSFIVGVFTSFLPETKGKSLGSIANLFELI